MKLKFVPAVLMAFFIVTFSVFPVFSVESSSSSSNLSSSEGSESSETSSSSLSDSSESGFPVSDGMIEVPQLYLELPTPEGWYIFTRSTPANDPNFDLWEDIDKSYMDQLFEQNSIYYNAIEPTAATQEIVVTMVENEEIFDWNDLSDSDYDFFANEIRSADMEELTGISGVRYGDYKMVDHPQCKLMKIEARVVNSEEQTSLIQYITIINGQHINITLRSYTGAISASDEKAFDAFVQELHFTEVKDKPFTIMSLLEPEFAVLTVSIGIGFLVVVVGITVICVVISRKKRKKREFEQMRQDHQELYAVQNQPFISEAPSFKEEDQTEDDPFEH